MEIQAITKDSKLFSIRGHCKVVALTTRITLLKLINYGKE